MRQIVWVLLLGPPTLAVLAWVMTRRWVSMMMRNRPRAWVRAWQKYDFWIILCILYAVMFSAAVLDHKL